MKHTSRTLTLILSALLFFTSQTGRTANVDPGDLDGAKPTTPPTQFNQIHSWKALQGRWAAGLAPDGSVLAIYDLSYPELLSKLPFALIGGRQTSKSAIIEAIWNAKFNPDADQKLADDAIDKLQNAKPGPIDDGALPQQWWKELPWKSNRSMTSEPASFRLSDLDIQRGMDPKKFAKFQKALTDLGAAFSDAEDLGAPQYLLTQIELVRVGEGTYQAYFHSNAASTSKPRKLVDLASTKSEFFNAMKLELAKLAFSQATGLIPGNLLSAIVKTTVSRFFHFQELVLRTHQNMLLEHLNYVQDQGLQDLNPTDMNKAIEGMSFAQSSLFSAWKWIWKKPVEEWNKDLLKHDKLAQENIGWMSSHQLQVRNMTNRFAWSLDPVASLTKLVLLSVKKPNSKNGPLTAIDYANPAKNHNTRLQVEAMAVAVEFGVNFIPVPYVGSVIKKAFDRFVMEPTIHARVWEGRLTHELEMGSPGANYASELKVLDSQRVNPLFQTREKMDQLIAARKKMIGL